MKQRVRWTADYIECPIKKTDGMHYTEFEERYKKWQDSLNIDEKLMPLPDRDAIKGETYDEKNHAFVSHSNI